MDRLAGQKAPVRFATHPVGWLLDCRSASILHAAAYAGWPTTWMPRPPAPDRFAFDCSVKQAKFLWVDPTFRFWAVWQENVDRVVHQVEQEDWPLVYRQGEHEVYANPRTWKGPALSHGNLVIGAPDVYRHLADRFMREEQYADALAVYRRLLRLLPRDADVLNNAAVAAARLKRFDQAATLWEEALEVDPEMLAARQGLAAISKEVKAKPPVQPSAVFGAAAAGVCTATLLQLGCRRGVALVAGWCLGFSKELWAQSVVAEVYTLNLFFTGLLIYQLLRWQKTDQTRHLVRLAALFGLGLGNHHTLLFVGVVALLWVIWQKRRVVLEGRLWVATAGAFFLELSIYLYVPLRAAADPYLNWGNPQTPQAFLAHFTRWQYPSDFHKPRSLCGRSANWARWPAWRWSSGRRFWQR